MLAREFECDDKNYSSKITKHHGWQRRKQVQYRPAHGTIVKSTKDRYYLIIAAQDRGLPSTRQGFCNMTVNVDNENDIHPRFTQSCYTATQPRPSPDTVVLIGERDIYFHLRILHL